MFRLESQPARHQILRNPQETNTPDTSSDSIPHLRDADDTPPASGWLWRRTPLAVADKSQKPRPHRSLLPRLGFAQTLTPQWACPRCPPWFELETVTSSRFRRSRPPHLFVRR